MALFGFLRRAPKRDIFTFHDGQRQRSADPLVIWRELDAHPEFRMDVHPALLDKGDPEAWKVCVDATRDAFDVFAFDEFDGKGLTEAETIELLGTFASFMFDVKKNTRLPLTSRAPTEPEYFPPEDTSNTSAFGSIWEEPKPAEPIASLAA